MKALALILLAAAPAWASLPVPEEAEEVSRDSGVPRADRRWELVGEVGWNSMTGLGAVVGYRVDPHVTIEAGLGISPEGGKAGARARYLFSLNRWSPFAGLGLLYGSGSSSDLTGDDRGAKYRYRVGPSPFLQLTFGVEYLGTSGFTFVAAGGYAALLQHNLDIVAGNPSPETVQILRVVVGTGIVLSVAFGKSF